ncbi:pimeloyl-ACP methyl ester carboxylesterase [Tamilnaduibacter salinus]|uniref:Pimeloyl-ACP methyl ester carboxylesterase n=1 Tax=Tamilnaduibacter salinus TaxID=1484056 RepID=A0A2U1CXW3_9GAMM|nr:alpha/beta fold hydrolase [Tamilnaduibacter salinus]PVY77341.1 pimeloyl-ACP methyl ester carboxylesterase [Tamilnaduibacter salinus]
MSVDTSLTHTIRDTLKQMVRWPDPWPLLRAGHRVLQRARRREDQVDGHRIVWLEQGHPSPDRPTVVLLHGLAAMKENWALWLPMLPKDWHVLAVDLPAFGESDYQPGADYGYVAQARRLLDWLASMDLGPVHLVGSSMGGGIATMMRGEAPDRVASLSVLNSAAIPAHADVDLNGTPDRDGSLMMPEDWQGVYRMFHGVGDGRPNAMSLAMMGALGTDLMRRSGQNRHVFSDLCDDPFAAVRVLDPDVSPLLVMWGDRDRVTPPGCVDHFRHHTPQAEIHVFRGVGHLPMIERPRQSADVLIRFVRRHHAG